MIYTSLPQLHVDQLLEEMRKFQFDHGAAMCTMMQLHFTAVPELMAPTPEHLRQEVVDVSERIILAAMHLMRHECSKFPIDVRIRISDTAPREWCDRVLECVKQLTTQLDVDVREPETPFDEPISRVIVCPAG